MVSCLCCAIPLIVVQLVTTAAALLYGKRWLLPQTGAEEGSSMRILRRVVNGLIGILVTLLAVVALSLVILQNNAGLRSQAFASFCTYMGLQSSALDEVRCPLLRDHIRGNVLEFGPGPGTNFRCLAAATNGTTKAYDITSYGTVDPNPHFDAVRQAEKERWNLTFPLVSVGFRGEDVDLTEPGSYDTVIGTHVLCSVDDPRAVLAAIDRALAVEGGQYVFLEHVLADANAQPTLRWWQENVLASLIAVVADGCQFLDIASLIRAQFGDPERYTLDIQSFQASEGVPPFMAPHIRGVVTKK